MRERLQNCYTSVKITDISHMYTYEELPVNLSITERIKTEYY
jgi:hypothetical protein